MSESRRISRREAIRAGGAMAAGAALFGREAMADPPVPAHPGDPWRGLKVGVATYTLREMPLDAAIKAVQRVGLSYASIKDMHLPMKSTPEERKAVARKFQDAGITLLSCGVVYMRNDEANIREAFEYARDTGIPTIVCSPEPASMDLLDRIIKDYDIRLAIHNHGPEDTKYPSPYDVWKMVDGHDKRIGLCIDVGHTARTGHDPAEAILKCRERLYDVHMKDIATLTPKAATLECGRGVLDIKAMMEALVKIRFPYHVGFEYEKDGKDPMPGLSESIGYTKGVMVR